MSSGGELRHKSIDCGFFPARCQPVVAERKRQAASVIRRHARRREGPAGSLQGVGSPRRGAGRRESRHSFKLDAMAQRGASRLTLGNGPGNSGVDAIA